MVFNNIIVKGDFVFEYFFIDYNVSIGFTYFIFGVYFSLTIVYKYV